MATRVSRASFALTVGGSVLRLSRAPPRRTAGAVTRGVDDLVTTLLSAGQVVLIALIPLLALAAWLILVFGADRESRHRAPRGGLRQEKLAVLACHPGWLSR